MQDPETIKWFATLGVGGVVAAFMFLYYRRDVKFYTELWQKQAGDNQIVLQQVMGVVRDNTAALTKVVAVVDSLHNRLDTNSHPYARNYQERDKH